MPRVLMAAYTNYRRDPRVRREAETLADRGYDVTFIARRQSGEPDRESVSGVQVIKLPGLANPKTSAALYMADYAIFFLLLTAYISLRPLRFDLIHINNMPDFLVFSTVVPRLMGRPVIHDVHDLMPELYMEKFDTDEKHWMIRLLMLQERWAGRFASAVLTVEGRLRDILSDRGIPREKIQVLMNLQDDRIFAKPDSRHEKSPGSAFVIAYHGTLARRLGLDVALRAIALVRDAIPEVELRIIGAGEEREPLLKLRDELGLADLVTFSEGFVPVESIPELLTDVDVGVVPLRISSGTDIMLPTKLLEYVSMEIPCLVPKTGTVSRYFDDDMVEFFEAENPASLAQSMLDLYRDRARRYEIAKNATERFGETHRWSEHKKVYTNLVDRLLAE